MDEATATAAPPRIGNARRNEADNPVTPDARENTSFHAALIVTGHSSEPAISEPAAAKTFLHRDYCPACQKRVEPKLPDVLPRCTLGNRTLVLSAMLHFLQGLTLGQIVDTFNFHLRMKVTPGGLVQMWHRLADLLFSWYEQIHSEILGSAKLHADETGWRVSGQTHWLWCFANDDNAFYMIDRSRGSPALQKFFAEVFENAGRT